MVTLPGAGSKATPKTQRAQLRCSSSLGDFHSYQQRWNDKQGSNDPIDQEWEVSCSDLCRSIYALHDRPATSGHHSGPSVFLYLLGVVMWHPAVQ